MKKLSLALVVIIAALGIIFLNKKAPTEISSFEECVAAGNPVMESYPEQCTTKDGKHFTRTL